MDRDLAEEDPSFKQLIPYCLVTRDDSLLVVERKAAQSERRLHGKLSVGLGGHINPEDILGSNSAGGGDETAEIEGVSPRAGAVGRALERELSEELYLPEDGSKPPHLVGLINDDTNPVGAVHVGLVFEKRLRGDGEAGSPVAETRIRETSKMAGGFRSLAASSDVWQDRRRFESWSWNALRALFPGCTQETPGAAE